MRYVHCGIFALALCATGAEGTTPPTVDCAGARTAYAEIGREAHPGRTIAENRFDTVRPLKELRSVFDYLRGPPSFKRVLKELGKDGHWIDVGCGTCRAVNDFLAERGVDLSRPVSAAELEAKNVPKVTGMMISDDFSYRPQTMTEKWRKRIEQIGIELPRLRRLREHGPKERLRVLVGTPVEEFPDAANRIGKADLITDVYGAASYAGQIDKVFLRYGELLKTGGAAFIHLSFEKTIIRTRTGRELSLQEYLEKFTKGFDVTWNGTQLRLVRNGNPLHLPPLTLTRVGNQTAPPPERYYTIDID